MNVLVFATYIREPEFSFCLYFIKGVEGIYLVWSHDLHPLKVFIFLCSVDESLGEPSPGVQPCENWWREEEQASLQQSLRNLQTEFAVERAQRAESEREAELLLMENAMLEQEVARVEVYQVKAHRII